MTSTLTLQSKNTATFTNQSKAESSLKQFLRYGKSLTLEDLANFTFTDVPFDDGTQLKDITIETLNNLVNQVWTNQSKS